MHLSTAVSLLRAGTAPPVGGDLPSPPTTAP